MGKLKLLGRASEFKKFKKIWHDWKRNPSPKLWTLSGPAGVGRTAFLTEVLNDLMGQHPVSRVSLLEDSCFRSLAKSLGRGLSEDGAVQFAEVIAAWQSRYETSDQQRYPLLVIEDLQELEGVEQRAFYQWLQSLLSGSPPVLVILEFNDSFGGFPVYFQPEQRDSIKLPPLAEADVAAWIKRVSDTSDISHEAVQELLKRTGGLPLLLKWWVDFLSGHSKVFYLPEVVQNWPVDESALVLEILSTLSAHEFAVLQVLQLHPSWITLSMVAAVGGVTPNEGQKNLNKWLEQDFLTQDSKDPDRYLLRFRALGKGALEDLSKEKRHDWHRQCYRFLKTQPEWLFLATWLAWHGSEGGLARQAFGSNLLAGEFFEAQGNFEVAEAYIQQALPFAEDAFRRAYAHYRLGEVATASRKFSLALDRLQSSFEEAKSIPWIELEAMASQRLAELYKYLGRYAEAELNFKEILVSGWSQGDEALILQLSLGHCHIEQAKYSEAGELFANLENQEMMAGDQEFQMTVELGRLQVDIALGKFTEATQKLKKLQKQLSSEASSLWQPLLLLLQGKVLILQGHINEALKILEDSAQAFKANQDIYGKVEVLLTMSAPLLEQNLVAEAEKILNLISHWKELPEIPALDHSVRLRRLALAAFHGPYRKEDLTLAHQDPFSFGRLEDWLQFWFHLALAGMNRKDQSFFRLFVAKALGIAKSVAANLSESDRQYFLRRPDIARILRLSGEDKSADAQQIRTDRRNEVSDSVEAGALAPPIRNPSPSE